MFTLSWWTLSRFPAIVTGRGQYGNTTHPGLPHTVMRTLGSVPAPTITGERTNAKGLLGHHLSRDQGPGEACRLCQACACRAGSIWRALSLPRQPERDL